MILFKISATALTVFVTSMIFLVLSVVICKANCEELTENRLCRFFGLLVLLSGPATLISAAMAFTMMVWRW